MTDKNGIAHDVGLCKHVVVLEVDVTVTSSHSHLRLT